MSQSNSDDLLLAAFIGIPAVALASIGGIGIVGGGLAFGLGSLELSIVGGGLGAVAHKAVVGDKSSKKTVNNSVSQSKIDRAMREAALARMEHQRVAATSRANAEINDLRNGRF